jgi:hypothetical protein
MDEAKVQSDSGIFLRGELKTRKDDADGAKNQTAPGPSFKKRIPARRLKL